ncbi:MAG: RidA family protein [Candidatus Firestonebacteria bacterium]
MSKEIINTRNAPKVIGPYSQAVKVDKLLFISGQIPVDPVTGSLILSGIEAQTKRVMDNIKAILESSGGHMDKIVKTTIYLKRIDDFKFVNEVYEKYFSGDFPARTTVEISNLPKKVDIEIDAIAVLD